VSSEDVALLIAIAAEIENEAADRIGE